MIASRLRRFLQRDTHVQSPDVTSPLPVDDRNARYDRETVEVINRVLNDGDTAIDIGANEGSILRCIVDRSPTGRHHAFEPIPYLAQSLDDRFPSVTVHQCALAAEPGESTFHHVVSNTGYSGLRERRYDRDNEQIEIITVPVARLDDVVPLTLPTRFVKIDVEGGELGVLTGGTRLLAACRPIVVFEHGLGGSDYYGTRPEDVLDVFDGVEYQITLMQRWLAGEPDLSRDQFLDEFATCRNYYFLARPR